MATSAQEAERMLQVARQTGKKLMIHFNYRFSPPSRFLKHYVDEGNLGRIYYAHTRWLRARGIPKLGGWFGIKSLSGGGPLIDLGVHRLDLAMWLLLGARLAEETKAQYDVEDMAVALVRLDNGATLNLEVSWAGGTDRREDMMTGIYGTAGAAIQRNAGEGYDFEALALRDMGGALVQVNPRIYPPTPSAIDSFLQCIIDDCEPEASAENGLEMMRILDAIYLSAARGCEVRLDG
jgi:predicted dehydrogenase